MKSLGGYYGLRRVLQKGAGIVGGVDGIVEEIAVVADGAAAASEVVEGREDDAE